MNNKKTTIHPNKVVHDLSNLQKKDYCNSFRIPYVILRLAIFQLITLDIVKCF